ncbi:MAG: hypothetical protein ACTSQS_18275 [Promethearchaeota archaeon]
MPKEDAKKNIFKQYRIILGAAIFKSCLRITLKKISELLKSWHMSILRLLEKIGVRKRRVSRLA